MKKQWDGQWQMNSYPDVGCRWSRGYKCIECPFPKCLDEYTPSNRLAVIKQFEESELCLHC